MNARETIVARLLDLIKAAGHSPHSLSIKMGWAKARLASKLHAKPLREDGTPNPTYRQTSLEDIDEILAALGHDITALFR